MNLHAARSAPILLLAFAAGAVHAQQITIPDPNVPPTAGFGSEAVIVNDVDGLGRRDLVIASIDPAGLNIAQITLVSTETGAVLGVFADGGLDLGRAMLNVGDIDGIPGDEVVVSSPNFQPGAGGLGLIWVLSATATLPAVQAVVVPQGCGSSLAALADLDGQGGIEIAAGNAQADQVFVLDILQLYQTATFAPLYTITDPRGGGFGASLASADGNRLAVGAPSWSNIVPPGPQLGYVNLYKLGPTSAVAGAFLAAPGPVTNPQRFGASIAAIGDLNGDGISEYAIQAPAANAAGPAVYTFSEIVPAGPLATFAYPSANGNNRGRVAALGDIDGDGRGDFATTDDVNLRLITTPNNTTLTAVALVPATPGYNGCLASGPDVSGMGVLDLISGRIDPVTGLGTVSVEPVAVLRTLPNPPNLSLAAAGRPFLGTNPYPLTVSTTETSPVSVILLVNLAPAQSIPFGNGIAYLDASTAVTLGFGGVVAGTPVTFTGISLPSVPSALYGAFVFQAAGFTSTNTWLASNGLLARLGTF